MSRFTQLESVRAATPMYLHAPMASSSTAKPRAVNHVDSVVWQLRDMSRSASLAFSLEVGRVIIAQCYRGDLSRWRSRGTKNASFRKIAEHPDLPMSPSVLYRCVAIYELCSRVGGAEKWQHVGISHARLVLGLPEEHQVRFLTAAEQGRWTVQQLQRETELARPDTRTTKGGRPPLPQCVRATRSVLRALDELGVQLPTADVELPARTYAELITCRNRMHRLLTTLDAFLWNAPSPRD
jgi:hypothetical protein